MDYIVTALHTLTGWVQPHLPTIALAVVATLLVIFGDDINRFVRDSVRQLPFLLRVGIFVLLCAFGYGAATAFLAPLLAQLLGLLPALWLGLAVVCIFLLLGWLAERRHQV